MDLTSSERAPLSSLSEKLTKVQSFINSNPLDEKALDSKYWYEYVATIKRVMGNFNNDVSFIACLMVKEFLTSRHKLSVFDATWKPQSAPGLDIDVVSSDGKRIIAEIKTTIPYGETDLGAQQKSSFLKDFNKLGTIEADYKYFFVTEKNTFEIVKKSYSHHLKGVTLVLLPQSIQDKGYGDYIVTLRANETPSSEQAYIRSKTFLGSTLSESKGHALSDSIRVFMRDNFIIPARKAGKTRLRIKSGDVHNEMNLRNRYPAVCSAMKGSKIEQLCNVRIIEQEGTDGANFYVDYAL